MKLKFLLLIVGILFSAYTFAETSCQVFIPSCEPPRMSRGLEKWLEKNNDFIGRSPIVFDSGILASSQRICDIIPQLFAKKCGPTDRQQVFWSEFHENDFAGVRFEVVVAPKSPTNVNNPQVPSSNMITSEITCSFRGSSDANSCSLLRSGSQSQQICSAGRGQNCSGEVTGQVSEEVQIVGSCGRSQTVRLSGSSRKVTFLCSSGNNGALTYRGDASDPQTDHAKNIVAGKLSESVASIELVATNAPVNISDIEITISGIDGDFVRSVESVHLYHEDNTLIASEVVGGSADVEFQDINYTVPQGSENIYVRLTTRKIGKNSAGVQTDDFKIRFQVTELDGRDGGVTFPVTDVRDVPVFRIVPVAISQVGFVDSYGGRSLSTKLSNGVDMTLAIIAITADSWSNTDSQNGSDLELVLEKLQIEKQGVAINDIRIRKIGGTDSSGVGGASLPFGTINGTFTLTDMAGQDEKIESSQTSYYEILGKPQLTSSSGESVKISLINLDDSFSENGLKYRSDDSTGSAIVDELRIGMDRITGPAISE